MEVQSDCLVAPAVTSPVLALRHHHHSRAVPCCAVLHSCVVPCSSMPCHTVPGCASPRHAMLAGGDEVPVTGGLVSLLSSMGWVTPECLFQYHQAGPYRELLWHLAPQEGSGFVLGDAAGQNWVVVVTS